LGLFIKAKNKYI